MTPPIASGQRVAERRSERLIEELLTAQGWDLRRPPQGDLLTQQEYKDHPRLREALTGSSKTGPGAGVPEFVLVDRHTNEPVAIFEAKARVGDLDAAVLDVIGYAEAFVRAGFKPLAVALAGTKDDRFDVRVLKKVKADWEFVKYEGKPIRWLLNREQLDRIRGRSAGVEMRPEVPAPGVLKSRAEEINGLLRESGLKDDFRPAAIGAIMLGLWKSGGDVRRDARFILPDINQACEKAFWDADKARLARSLHVDEANTKLAVRALRIVEILERLNITTLTAEHDYLGALYEEFFRYTGGNTIGQYFTPRHITRMMADLCAVGRDDVVLDPACGTGGFLIAAMERMQQVSSLPREEIVKLVQKQLIGIEDEPVTASLCVANMILRGDGSTGVSRADCFDDRTFPAGAADVVLMNPPFPHRRTDVPIDRFIDRALEGLKRHGHGAVIVKTSMLVKGDTSAWRQNLLSEHSLLAVITLPGELFQPYASATTAILLFEKGVPHSAKRRVFFCRVENDGFRIKKGTRVPQAGGQLGKVSDGLRSLRNEPGFCIASPLAQLDNWAPGAYIEARPLTAGEFRDEVAALIRNKAAFAARFAPQLARLSRAVAGGSLTGGPYRPTTQPARLEGGTIGDLFELYYGQKALHSKEHLEPGPSLVISSSGADSGAYGFFDYPHLIRPPFVTVPSTGSIGEAAVQEFPCGVTDDCLLLIPRQGTPFEALYVAAATLRHERWRFDYGRKMTPDRIRQFPLRLDPALLAWVKRGWEQAHTLQTQALDLFGTEDATMDEPIDTENEGGAPFERFEELTRRLLTVPKSELDERRAVQSD